MSKVKEKKIVHESDVCIIGSGMVGLHIAKRILLKKPGTKITVVEAGRSPRPLNERFGIRQRFLDYEENSWPGDIIYDQVAVGVQSYSMVVGGWATHWAANINRMSAEDFKLKSMYGLAVDWPLTYEDLEPYYILAEKAIGVSGDPGPEENRSAPYPMPSLPLSYNMKKIKDWAEKSGVPFHTMPQGKNSVPYDGRPACMRCDTCEICPIGAKYSPDRTVNQMVDAKQIELHSHTLVRRLVHAKNSNKIEMALANDQRDASRSIEYRAKVFVVAAGRIWAPPLLLLSKSDRFPNGIGNSSGLVGKYVCFQQRSTATIHLPHLQNFFGMNTEIEIQSTKHFRCDPKSTYARYLVYMNEALPQASPMVRDKTGKVLIGDEIMNDWQNANIGAAVRTTFLNDVHPALNSEIVLDPQRKNRWGDPQPTMTPRMDQSSLDRFAYQNKEMSNFVDQLVKKGGGKVLRSDVLGGGLPVHESGGCRMGNDPKTSICDSYGQTHDHENLFVAGSATLPTVGCSNPSITYLALGMRSGDRIGEVL